MEYPRKSIDRIETFYHTESTYLDSVIIAKPYQGNMFMLGIPVSFGRGAKKLRLRRGYTLQNGSTAIGNFKEEVY